MSESCDSALVAAVARSECTHNPITSPLMPVSAPYLHTMLRYTEPGSRGRSRRPVRLFLNRTEISDMAAVERMVEGVDGIIHLGGNSGENTWDVILQPNIIGVYNVFEAARRAGVQRVVMATSNHAVGFYPRTQTIDHRVLPRPDSRYGLSKAFSEALASLYADKHEIGFLCVRIGNFGTLPIDKRRLSIWISPRDLTQLVRIGLEHPDVRYEIVYGVSNISARGTITRTRIASATSLKTVPSFTPRRCWLPSRPTPTQLPNAIRAAPCPPPNTPQRRRRHSPSNHRQHHHGTSRDPEPAGVSPLYCRAVSSLYCAYTALTPRRPAT